MYSYPKVETAPSCCKNPSRSTLRQLSTILPPMIRTMPRADDGRRRLDPRPCSGILHLQQVRRVGKDKGLDVGQPKEALFLSLPQMGSSS